MKFKLLNKCLGKTLDKVRDRQGESESYKAIAKELSVLLEFIKFYNDHSEVINGNKILANALYREFYKGYEVGRNIARRSNLSGCCCEFDDNEEIVSLCQAHIAYYAEHGDIKTQVSIDANYCHWKCSSDLEYDWNSSCGSRFEFLMENADFGNGIMRCKGCNKKIKLVSN